MTLDKTLTAPLDIEGFKTYLKATRPNLGDSSADCYHTMFRRVQRDLGSQGLFDPCVLTAYRQQLPQGTRNIFDGFWDLFREWAAHAHGIELPERPVTPRIRMAHPLHHDMTIVSGFMGPGWLERTTWGSFLSDADADPTLRASLERILSFYTGKTPDQMPEGHPIIAHGTKTEPMPMWQVNYIVNSPQHTSSGCVDTASAEIFSILASMRAPARVLRMVAQDLHRIRHKVTRKTNPKKFVSGLVDLLREKKLPEFNQQVFALRSADDEISLPLW